LILHRAASIVVSTKSRRVQLHLILGDIDSMAAHSGGHSPR
jgi:hypothetical protein